MDMKKVIDKQSQQKKIKDSKKKHLKKQTKVQKAADEKTLIEFLKENDKRIADRRMNPVTMFGKIVTGVGFR